jgi:hypothetical protein
MNSGNSIAATAPSTSDSSRYPSTGFNSFIAANSQPANSQNSAALAETPRTSTPPASGTARINSEWQTQSQPVAPASKPFQPSSNQPVSHTAELPAELQQRSGSYAPGSVGGGASGDTIWR